MRPLLVYPLGKEHIILGGNLRFEGAKKNKDKDCPAIVVPPGTPVEKLKEIVIKDNGAFGEWDMDMLANEWDDLPLSDWGVPAWKMESVDLSAVDALFEESNKPKKEEELHITIVVPKYHEEKMEDIEKAVMITIEEWAGCSIK